ncbi:uncharacterized protein ARMOST_01589 [Armillaria ostoyae]|uniref:Uncharacterized protein n=1 Tax=Armillaria ostoyae TaxID=47428 RepID=A0A284QP98_ARMOS|nr:uncharacterized protein ARMOST_01589 [Armillaria ostoyae]
MAPRSTHLFDRSVQKRSFQVEQKIFIGTRSSVVDTRTAPAFRVVPLHMPCLSIRRYFIRHQSKPTWHPSTPIYPNGGPDETTQDTTLPSSFSKSPPSSMPTSSSSSTTSPSSPRKFTRSAASAQSSI